MPSSTLLSSATSCPMTTDAAARVPPTTTTRWSGRAVRDWKPVDVVSEFIDDRRQVEDDEVGTRRLSVRAEVPIELPIEIIEERPVAGVALTVRLASGVRDPLIEGISNACWCRPRWQEDALADAALAARAGPGVTFSCTDRGWSTRSLATASREWRERLPRRRRRPPSGRRPLRVAASRDRRSVRPRQSPSTPATG